MFHTAGHGNRGSPKFHTLNGTDVEITGPPQIGTDDTAPATVARS